MLTLLLMGVEDEFLNKIIKINEQCVDMLLNIIKIEQIHIRGFR